MARNEAPPNEGNGFEDNDVDRLQVPLSHPQLLVSNTKQALHSPFSYETLEMISVENVSRFIYEIPH